MFDYTLKDHPSRELSILDDRVKQTLPSFFAEKYPNLIKLLEFYYEFMRETDSFDLFHNDYDIKKNIALVNELLLSFIEQELLLGQSFGGGESGKRFLLQNIADLYKNKGSTLSIQKFFKFFYGVDPEVIYTKRNVFIVDDSLIGPESERYIINDRLYQTFAVLIKTPIPVSVWKDAYKLFVHPAGTYLGAEVQIVSVSNIDYSSFTFQETIGDVTFRTETRVSASFASYDQVGSTSVTGIIEDDSDSFMRIPFTNTFERYSLYEGPDSGLDSDGLLSVGDVNKYYSDIEQNIEATSPTMDEDSDVAITMSNTIETTDQDEFLWWSGDSDTYINQITSSSNI